MFLSIRNVINLLFITASLFIFLADKTDTLPVNESEYVALYEHYDNDVINARNPQYPIHPLLLSRMSVHEMSGEEISDNELFALFEAARWSPSNYNIQPWNYVYAKRKTARWQQFFELLVPVNQHYCINSSVLIISVANVYEIYKGQKRKNDYYSYDTGAAALSLTLEASARGLASHEIAGFNVTAAADLLGISDNSDYSVQVMIAIGRRPPQALRTVMETMTPRVTVETFVSKDVFKPREIHLL